MTANSETRSRGPLLGLLAGGFLLLAGGGVAVGLVGIAGVAAAFVFLTPMPEGAVDRVAATPADPTEVAAIVQAPEEAVVAVEDTGAPAETDEQDELDGDDEQAEAEEPPDAAPAPRPRRPAPTKPAPAPATNLVTATFEVAQADAYVEIGRKKVSGPVQLAPGRHEVMVGRGVEGRVFKVTVTAGEANAWCYDFDAKTRVREGSCGG